MITPYKGTFRVSQTYKNPRSNGPHQGFDMVGTPAKGIYSPVYGTVERAGWENPLLHGQGFGLYVRIRVGKTAYRMYFGHLSEIYVRTGQTVKPGALLGIEGSTGRSTGSHLHWEIRNGTAKRSYMSIAGYSNVPNACGMYTGDQGISTLGIKTLRTGQNQYPYCLYNAALQGMLGLAQDGIYGSKTAAAVKDFQLRHGLEPDGLAGPATKAALMQEV